MKKLLAKQRKMLANFLPKKVVSSPILTFQVSPPISPVGKGSSSVPVIGSLIPKEAPRKSKNGSFEAREPASPKVSCIGQIKGSKKKNQKQAVGKSKVASPSASPSRPPQAISGEQVRRKLVKGTKPNVYESEAKIAEAKRVPSLGHLKQFSSARGTLSDFDWKACDAAEEAAAAGSVTVDVVNVNEETRKAMLWNRRTMKPLTPLQL